MRVGRECLKQIIERKFRVPHRFLVGLQVSLQVVAGCR